MFSVALIMAALGGWGSGGYCPDGGPPSMPVFFPAPQVFAPPVVQPPPPFADGIAKGKLLRVEIEHADGRRWWYTFAAPPDVTLNLDPANNNTAINLAGGNIPKDGKCKNPNCICSPPCNCLDCKCEDKPLVGQKPNFGIDEKEMQKRSGRNRYSTNGGVEISKTETNRLFRGDSELPNDSTYDMLAVIGTQEQCDKVRNDVDSDPAFAPLKDKLLIQCYRPDDEMVKRKGFHPGSPAIYLQDSNGKTKWREVEYRGPKILAGEIDKRRPDNDPNKDPGPHNPGPSPIIPSMPNIDLQALSRHPLVLIVAAFAALLFLSRKPV